MTVDWGHDHLANDLALHLRCGGERWVWQNMAVLGSGQSRPDVYALKRWSYDHPELVAYEVKISVADLRSDLTGGKWQKYLKIAGGVTFAVPQGLCTLKDIPSGCGLIVRGSKMWRHLRRPTLQRIELPTGAWLRLINVAQGARSGAGETADRYHASDYYRREHDNLVDARARRKIGERLGKDIAEYLAAPKSAREVLDKATAKAKQIVENARVEAAAEAEQAKAALAGIRTAFGMPADASEYSVLGEVKRRAQALQVDAEVRRLRSLLREAARVLDGGEAVARIAEEAPTIGLVASVGG
jgi:hypothetical protein